MTDRTLRFLLLEDSSADAELISIAMSRASAHALFERVDDEEGFTAALRDFAPDVVISDHALAQFDGFAALRLVNQLRPGTPVIIATGSAGEKDVVAFVRAGAEGLVLKENLSRLPEVVNRAISVRERLARLSPRQIEVLRMVAQGHTTREIAARLALSAKTVEAHRGEIMKRTGIHDVVSLVRYAIRVGLVSAEE